MQLDSLKSVGITYRSRKTLNLVADQLRELKAKQTSLLFQIEKSGGFEENLNRQLSILNHKIEVAEARQSKMVSVYHRRTNHENHDTHTLEYYE
jgi:hypothetical protein